MRHIPPMCRTIAAQANPNLSPCQSPPPGLNCANAELNPEDYTAIVRLNLYVRRFARPQLRNDMNSSFLSQHTSPSEDSDTVIFTSRHLSTDRCSTNPQIAHNAINQFI